MASKHPRARKRYHHSSNQTDHNQYSRLPQHHPLNVPALRSHRNANTDLSGLPRNRMGHHSIKTRSAKSKSNQPEASQQYQTEALLRDRSADNPIQWLNIKQRHMSNLKENTLDRRKQIRLVRFDTHHPTRTQKMVCPLRHNVRNLPCRQIENAGSLRAQALLPHVANHANNFTNHIGETGAGTATNLNLLTNGTSDL